MSDPELRILFLGATEFGHRCCEELLRNGETVAGILSIGERFRISYSRDPVRNVTYRSFHDLADRYGVPLVELERGPSVDEYLVLLDEWRPDFGLAIGWYYMVPSAVRERLPRGLAGIHASLLPSYRGGAPLVWAMINGERETGVTLFYLDDGVDTGDVLARRAFPIDADDTIATVYEKAVAASLGLLRETVPLVREGRAPRVPQDHAQATEFPQRSPKDGLIDWSRSAREIRDFIRAQTRPYPGAFTVVEGKKVTIWDADVEDLDGAG